jgi:hypothetical protein
MAMIAIAAGIVHRAVRRRRRRGPNLIRQGCATTERDWLALRLTDQELHTLANEFCQWRLHSEGVRTTHYFCERRMKLVLLYLARGGYFHQFGRSEGLSLTATHTYLHQVSTFFADTAAK